MPSLPISGPTPLDGGELPVRSSADVLGVFPAEVRRPLTAPVRDALVAAFEVILKEYQRRSRRAAAGIDLTRATGHRLEGLARDHEVYKQDGEEDEALRARLLTALELVTPEAILAAVNAILDAHTTIKAKYFESEVDQWFVTDETATYESFVFVGTTLATPHYADRLYVDDAVENGGDTIAARDVPGAVLVADAIGRRFHLRLPPVESVDSEGTYSFATSATDDGMFVADGSDTGGSESDGTVTSFVYVSQVLSDELYAAIVSAVDLLKGQGIRWSAMVDPLLV